MKHDCQIRGKWLHEFLVVELKNIVKLFVFANRSLVGGILGAGMTDAKKNRFSPSASRRCCPH
jgi:hypothetical protein